MSTYVAPASNAPEDAGDEPRIRGVQDRIASVHRGDGRDIGRVGGIDLRGHEPAVGAEPVDDAPGAGFIDVGEHDLLVEVPPRRDRRERGADTSRTDDQDPHGGGV